MASFRSSALASAGESVRGLLDTRPGTFLAGWALVVGGVALQSVSWALIVGGALVLAAQVFIETRGA